LNFESCGSCAAPQLATLLALAVLTSWLTSRLAQPDLTKRQLSGILTSINQADARYSRLVRELEGAQGQVQAAEDRCLMSPQPHTPLLLHVLLLAISMSLHAWPWWGTACGAYRLHAGTCAGCRRYLSACHQPSLHAGLQKCAACDAHRLHAAPLRRLAQMHQPSSHAGLHRLCCML
jgi:hypothetical protein